MPDLNIRNTGMKEKYQECKKFVEWYEKELSSIHYVAQEDNNKHYINEFRKDINVRRKLLKEICKKYNDNIDNSEHPYNKQILYRQKEIKKMLLEIYKPEKLNKNMHMKN